MRIKEKALIEKEKSSYNEIEKLKLIHYKEIEKIQNELQDYKMKYENEKQKSQQLLSKNEILLTQLKEKDDVIKKLTIENKKKINDTNDIRRDLINNNNNINKNENRRVKSEIVRKVLRKPKTTSNNQNQKTPLRSNTPSYINIIYNRRIPSYTPKTHKMNKVNTKTPLQRNNSTPLTLTYTQTPNTENIKSFSEDSIISEDQSIYTDKKNKSIFLDGPLTPQQLSSLCEKVKRYENAKYSVKVNNGGFSQRYNEMIEKEAENMDQLNC